MTNSEVKQMMIDSSVEGERHLWNSEVEVCEIVGNLVALTKAKRVLEIGVFQGLTSEEIIKRLPDNSYFAGIDIEDFRLSNHNWIGQPTRACDFILGSSANPKTYRQFEDKFDFVFVDSMHYWEHIYAEWKQVEQMLADGGTVVYHDTIHIADVARLMEYIKGFEYNVLTLNTPGNRGLTIITRK
jgi:predicted O-methyltransferase YrrM